LVANQFRASPTVIESNDSYLPYFIGAFWENVGSNSGTSVGKGPRQKGEEADELMDAVAAGIFRGKELLSAP